jgi:ferredoxin/flavodoxin---NADP+ reductase
MQVPELNAVVTNRLDLGPGVMILRVAPRGWALPPFKPGQFAVLGLPAEAPRSPLSDPDETVRRPGALIRRSYSIASSSHEREYLEFYLTLVRSGELSPRLFALGEGDPLWLGPKITGLFTLDQVPAGADLVMVATGTGLAPYMSMLRTHLEAGTPRRVAVIHGARHSWDLGYRGELMAYAQRFEPFTYLPIVSRPGEENPPWAGPVGRVQDLWCSGAVACAWGLPPSPENTHVLLCGNPAMIEDMVALLGRQGFQEHTRAAPGQVHAEKYW